MVPGCGEPTILERENMSFLPSVLERAGANCFAPNLHADKSGLLWWEGNQPEESVLAALGGASRSGLKHDAQSGLSRTGELRLNGGKVGVPTYGPQACGGRTLSLPAQEHRDSSKSVNG